MPPAVVSASPKQQEQAEEGHENMKSVLSLPTDVPARRSRPSRGRSGLGMGQHSGVAHGDTQLMPASSYPPRRDRACHPKPRLPSPGGRPQLT